MENHHRPAKRRREEAVAGVMEEEDRISQLPEQILHHHILSLLPQKDAVQTCVLSKSWRHLGPTRPKIELVEIYICKVWILGRSSEKFKSVVENTLQRYDDQNLPIQEFILRVCGSDSGSILPLNKWISKVIKNMGLKIFSLSATNFSLPLVVFQSEFLTDLKLVECKLDQIKNNNCINNVLKRLSLHAVYLDEEIFEKIMSSCPLIEHLVLSSCHVLRNVKVNKARNLKHLYCSFYVHDAPSPCNSSIEINDDAPSLETIRIHGLGTFIHNTRYHLHNNNYFFPRLKSLYLHLVHLPTESLNNLSSDNCPCLEKLEIRNCSGFSEFTLSNRSIKYLIINEPERPIEAAIIDAPNMLYFEYRCCYLPTISFSPTSRNWKSQIEVWRSNVGVLSTWDLKLHEFLKSLSQSQIFLDFSLFCDLTNKDISYDGCSCEPVVVEYLCFEKLYSSSVLPVLLNCLFRICRPRYIGLTFMYENRPEKRELAESIWKTLVEKGESKFWQQDLEESSIHVLDENAHEWRPVQVCEFSNNEKIRLRLKWRDN